MIKEYFTLEDGLDSLSRNVGKKLPLLGSTLFTWRMKQNLFHL